MHPYCLYLHFLQLSESLQTSQINDWHPLKDVHTLVHLVHISVYIPWCVLLCFHVDSENQVGASVPPPRMLGQHYLKGTLAPVSPNPSTGGALRALSSRTPTPAPSFVPSWASLENSMSGVSSSKTAPVILPPPGTCPRSPCTPVGLWETVSFPLLGGTRRCSSWTSSLVLSLSLYLCVCLSLFICLSASLICLYVSLCLCLSVSLSVFVCFSFSFYLCLHLSLFLPFSPCVFISLFLSLITGYGGNHV